MRELHARLEQLLASADRYDEFAETAELMGDDAGATGFRAHAHRRRLQAMELLDETC